MKKLFSIVLALMMVVSITSCGGEGGTQGSTNSNEATGEVSLTVENIEDYLTLSFDVHDVKQEYLVYAGGYVASGKITIKSSPRKRGVFNDVILNVTLNPKSDGWKIGDDTVEGRQRDLLIPFNGNFEETIEINGLSTGYLTTNPNYELVINSVSGTFTEG